MPKPLKILVHSSRHRRKQEDLSTAFGTRISPVEVISPALSISTCYASFMSECLAHPGKPLSLRATAHFYGRICRNSLHYKPSFKEAVAAHFRLMEGGASSPAPSPIRNGTQIHPLALV